MARIENWNPPKLSVNTAIYEWDVDYAADVHEGVFTDKNSNPARPWTDDAIGRTNLEQEFRQAYVASEDLDESFQELAQILFNEFHVSMESEIWDWPRQTKRRSGEIVDSPRNIVDLGDLYDSQTLSFEYKEIE